MCSVLIILSVLLVSAFAFPPDHHFHDHGHHYHHDHHDWHDHDHHDHHDWPDHDYPDFHFGSFPEHNHGYYPIQHPEHGFKSPNQGGHKQTQLQTHQIGKVEKKIEHELMQKLDHELNDKLAHRLEKGIDQIFNINDNKPSIGGRKDVPLSNIGASDDRLTAVFREQAGIQNSDSGFFRESGDINNGQLGGRRQDIEGLIGETSGGQAGIGSSSDRRGFGNSNERGINGNFNGRDLNTPDTISNPNNGGFDDIGSSSGIINLAQSSGDSTGQMQGFNGIFTRDSTSSSSQTQTRSTSGLIIAGQNNVGQPSQQGGQVLRRNTEQENNGISIRSGGVSSSTGGLNLQQAITAIDDLAN